MKINGTEVKPGMFCRYNACSIWFEILYVGDDWLKVVDRDPRRQTEYVGGYYINSPMFHLSVLTPKGDWVAGTGVDRRKNFYDKFHPELHRIVAWKQRLVYSQHRQRVPQGTHSPVAGF